jgi:hypothetical protein
MTTTDTFDTPAMFGLTAAGDDLLFDDLWRATTIEAALLDVDRELASTGEVGARPDDTQSPAQGARS